jgi:hypothetical protein
MHYTPLAYFVCILGWSTLQFCYFSPWGQYANNDPTTFQMHNYTIRFLYKTIKSKKPKNLKDKAMCMILLVVLVYKSICTRASKGKLRTIE